MVPGDDVIWQNEIAVRNGRRMADVDAVVFNFSVWAWPQYARVAAQFCPQPIVMFSNVNPQYPGLVGMLANSGSLDQAGIPFTKSFGDIEDDVVFARLRSQIVAVAAARRLRGLTYCLIGGRSLGIDTTVIDPGAVDEAVRHRRGSRRSVRARAPRGTGAGGRHSRRPGARLLEEDRSAHPLDCSRMPRSGSPRICCGGRSRCTTRRSI